MSRPVRERTGLMEAKPRKVRVKEKSARVRTRRYSVVSMYLMNRSS